MRSLELFWPCSISAKNLAYILTRGLSTELTCCVKWTFHGSLSEIKVLGRRDNVKSKFQLSVNDPKSTLSKASALRKINRFACNLSEINVFAVARWREIKILMVFTSNQHFFKVARCKRSIFRGILSEITVFAVTCWRDNKYKFLHT